MPVLRLRVNGNAYALLGWMCERQQPKGWTWSCTWQYSHIRLTCHNSAVSVSIIPHDHGTLTACAWQGSREDVEAFLRAVLGRKLAGEPLLVSNEQAGTMPCPLVGTR